MLATRCSWPACHGTGGGSALILFPSIPPFLGWKVQVSRAGQLLNTPGSDTGLGCRALARGSAPRPPGYILTVPGKCSSVIKHQAPALC